jgi:Uma2 family endonuclease
MATVQHTRATLDDLYRTTAKAELVDGRIVTFMPTGEMPGYIAGLIYASLLNYSLSIKSGRAYAAGVGYAVARLLSGRESFSPDASYHRGPLPQNRMKFFTGGPSFAVEVRSECDYAPSAEVDMADKRTDYFQAGTEVVWDVDPLAKCIHCYRASDPVHPATFRRGDVADAEPAVPGWRVAVDSLFAFE